MIDAVDTYGDRLREAMRLAGNISQTDLAKAIGVTKATVNQALSGRSTAMSAPNSALAAEVLQVDHY